MTDRARDNQPLTLLAEPADGVPAVTDTAGAYRKMHQALMAGTGPLGIDTERAHGYRYFSKAWLIQIRREGAGTFLLDPSAFAANGELADFSMLGSDLAEVEWIVHAASQDLPSLVEVGLAPQKLFDTELAGRLLGFPKVSLAVMAERLCGVRLAKEHSAADWSQRPLPEEWLRYAALDVELLTAIRDALAQQLDEAGKAEWARQEFQYLTRTSTVAPAPRPDPWRRTSGMHTVTTRRGLAIVRELWQTRDAIARRRDKAPGRILQDRAIVAAASRDGLVAADLSSMKAFQRGTASRYLNQWGDAIRRVEAMAPAQFPSARGPSTGRSTPRNWQYRHPEAYQRFLTARPVLQELASVHDLPQENLLAPAAWHAVCFKPPPDITAESVDAALAARQARPWQRELTAPALAHALGTS